MMSILKQSLLLNNRNVDLKTFDATNWDDLENRHKVSLLKFQVDVTDDDIASC